MLVPFIVNSDSLSGDPNWSSAHLTVCHHTLLEVWRSMGMLIHDGHDFSTSNLQAAIQRLPPKIKPLWLELAKQMPIVASENVDWTGNIDTKAIAHFPNQTEVAFVDDTIAEVEFELGEHDLSLHCAARPMLEICRIDASNQSIKFKAAVANSVLHVEIGEPYLEIWNARFRNLAKAPIKRISIVDRYTIQQQFETPQSELSGISRFLRLLNAESASNKYVTIFSARTESIREKTIADIQNELQSILNGLPQGGLKRIKVILAPNSKFGELAHDRFVRFEKFVWDLGRGVDILSGAMNSARSSATFKSGNTVANYEKIEVELDHLGRANSFTISR